MDQSGRFRSRIGKPSGLRPPTVRGAAAAAGPCPAAQGIAPCPAAERASPSRLPRIPRPASRLPDPRVQRVASPPRGPSPSRGAIPKRTSLRPPASYATTSRLPAAPRPVRVIPQHEPKPEAPMASTVPVARVISPVPRAVSPARTLAVPLPQDFPGAAAAVYPAAIATPPRRRLPQPSRLRRPAVKTENVVAVPVVQAPGSPPKRILVPESVAASEQETIVAVPKVPSMEEVYRLLAELERRLSLEGAAAPCSPRLQATAVAPCSSRSQAIAAAPLSPLSPWPSPPVPCEVDRKWEAMQRRLSMVPQSSPIVEASGSPREAAAVINQAVENATAALVEQEKEEEDAVASALHLLQDQRRRLVLSLEKTSKPVATPVLKPATMRYIDAKWDRLMRDLYGDEYADSLLPERPHLSPILPVPTPRSFELDQRWDALQRLAAETPRIEDEVMPEYYVLFAEGGVSRRLMFEAENLPPSTLPEIDPDSAFVLAGIVEAVAQVEESDDESSKAGLVLIEDITPPPEFFAPDVDKILLNRKRASGLPCPLKPQRVWPISRRRRITPTLRSPIGAPSRYPVAYLRMLSGYKSPEYIADPFSNPPEVPPLHKYLDKFIDIDELEAFLAGTFPEEEESEEVDTTWADSTPENTYDSYYHRYTRY